MVFEHLPWRLQTLVGRILTPHSWSLSQAGQDAWVFGEAFNEMRKGFFVDIGAHDGVTISNTYLLDRRYGWVGLCIEANPVTFELLRQSRRATCLNICLDREPGEVEFATRGVLGGIIGDRLDNKASSVAEQTIRLQTRTLQAVLMEHRAPNVVD